VVVGQAAAAFESALLSAVARASISSPSRVIGRASISVPSRVIGRAGISAEFIGGLDADPELFDIG
jgi:hypothetical protein